MSGSVIVTPVKTCYGFSARQLPNRHPLLIRKSEGRGDPGGVSPDEPLSWLCEMMRRVLLSVVGLAYY